MGFYQNSAFLL